MHDSALLLLVQKVRSWISWGNNYWNSVSRGFEIMDNNCNICCHCKSNLSKSYIKYLCQNCGRLMCGNCIQALPSLDEVESTHLKGIDVAMFNIKSCRFCFELGSVSKRGSRCSVKIYPSEFPSLSPGPSSPTFSGERSGHSLHEWTSSRDASLMNHPLPESVHCSPSRSDEDEEEDSSCHFFGAPSDNLQDASDADSCSVSTRHDFCSSISVGSSPSYSPSRLHITSTRVGKYVQVEHRGNQWSQSNSSLEQEQVVLERPDKGIWVVENANDLSINQDKHENFLKPLDIETNGLIWFPPPPDDEVEENIFAYDDDDVEDPTFVFGPTDVGSTFFAKEKLHLDCKERWKALVDGHFRALVSQLLEGQGILDTKDNPADSWLDIVTSIAWQTAKFIKPDRSRGGSMDPCDYVKVKCVASGSRCESKLIKGVVCTKNIKHKRMMTQYENAKLLLLGGALEYQRVPNKLASFETLLQQENDQLKAIVSKIVAHRPNVLLVEKSVSSFALEHLLAKEVSLVLNIKRPLLERIARCTGASITPTTDHISAARLGHCELFRVEKISEDHEAVNQFNKKPSKSFMFFEGCPWRLGCTVVLRGSCREELKKIKHVVQYAVFAAYHLLLETSFLADEGASLPQLTAKPSCVIPKKPELDKVDYVIPDSEGMTSCKEDINDSKINMGPADLPLELGLQESLPDFGDTGCEDVSIPDEFRYRDVLHEACDKNLAMDLMTIDKQHIFTESLSPGEEQSGEVVDIAPLVKVDEVEVTSEYTSANDSHQSILVYFSSHCMMNGTVCERSRLLRIKFYGLSDKPLGRYLSDDLFNQSHRCRSCKESAEAHVMCYTHRHASLTVNVRCLPSVKLPGELNGKIWMWHRCLSCARLGIPQTTRRVAMSNAAWGISFGKFLELSFSNHATGNRVASCGHSMQRDCLRFYGLGSMVAFFHYSPINILSVRLPPSILEFSSPGEQSWIASEAYELLRKVETLHSEISHFLEEFKQKSSTSMDEFSDASALHNHVLELLEMISEERNYYKDLLHNGAEKESPELDCTALDILEINRLRHALLVSSRAWDRCLYSLESLFQKISSPKPLNNAADPSPKSCSLDLGCMSGWPSSVDFSSNAMTAENDECNSSICEPDSHENYALSVSMWEKGDGVANNKESAGNVASLRHCSSAASILSDKIDSAWSGANQAPAEAHLTDSPKRDVLGTIPFEQTNNRESPSFKRLWGPTRVYSFDSAQMLRERITKGLSPHFSTMRSFHASGDYRYMIRDPVINVQRTYSLSNASSNASPTFLSLVSLLPDGARLMVLRNDTVVTVYDDEPTSVISCALSSKVYEDWVTDSPYEPERGRNIRLHRKTNSLASNLSTSMSFGSMDFDNIRYGSSSSEDTFPTDQNNSPHLRISFEDDSSNATGKVKFSVTCYFAKQFDSLQRRCCPRIGDLVRSLSRCRRWSAEGGKSNVYFAKSFDDRFIIKQVTKTERDSFEVFAPEYFKYLTNALRSGSPTCLAKIVGMYQVNVKHVKGGREVKMDLMVMENLFFKRNLSKVFDLKGSGRSRYNPDVEGGNKVLLDSNLLETVRTNPIFLGSKAKRRLERAIWNDTSFLASVDVMDYSLLVGVDEESKELVVGIIDFMRQYTWDKQLETWVKASGLLGGPKNAAPTIVSPIQYKKRFRKAMTAYFLTVPDK